MPFKKSTPHTLFKILTIVVVPLLVSLVLIGHYLDPRLIDLLAYEDDAVETVSATVLFAGVFIWLIYIAMQLKQRQWLNIGIAAVFAATMFLIGMEEISWGQRILKIESSEFFLENNMQGETNLHNLDTNLSETIFYAGGVVFLVLLPFLNALAVKLIRKLKHFASLEKFLPSAWLLVPFTALLAFTGKGNITDRPILIAIFIMGFVAVVARIIIELWKRRYMWAFVTSAILAIALIGSYTFLNFNAEVLQVRQWHYTEYLELVIELGLLAYTIDVVIRTRGGKKQPIDS